MTLSGPAAAKLYDDHVDAIWAYVARRLGTERAVEIVGDVFEHALRMYDRRPPKTSERGWLLAIASALLRRHGAAENARLHAWYERIANEVPPIATSDPLLATAHRESHTSTTAAVMDAVAALEPVDRDVLFLTAWEHCSTGQTAEATGLQPSEVRARLGAIRKELRRHVGEPRTRNGTPGA